MGFAGASYASVRFDVVGSPTEVINTGRSEVTGSVNLIVRGTGNVTGTSTGGSTQIAFLYTNPAMQIDNTTTSGIRLFFSSGFIPAFTQVTGGPAVGIVIVQNIDVNGRCSGAITINMLPGATPAEGAFIRLEGVRGRIDASTAITPGTDLFVAMQSVNDPAAQNFTPDIVRVAKSFDGINVSITPDTLLLCFPTLGKPPGVDTTYSITITEGFARAFVDSDANNDGNLANDRVDSGGQTAPQVYEVGTPPAASTASHLGAPTNSTQLLIWFESIPASVSGIIYQLGGPPPEEGSSSDAIYNAAAKSSLVLVSSSFTPSAGVSQAIYSYEAFDQTSLSDIIVESYTLSPRIVLKSGSTVTGTIITAVSLAPTVSESSGCAAPSATPARPRFLLMYESDAVATNNPPSDPHKPYASIIRCNCYLLFTYVTAASGFNTGIVIANTTGDTAPFGASEAPDQIGKITFYFYDKTAAYVGATTTAADVTAGKSFVDLVSAILPSGVTSFSGYVIAKAEFQFCHGFAFIADSGFATVAQGYLANVIPDPAIRWPNGVRTAADAGDAANIVAGEGLNN